MYQYKKYLLAYFLLKPNTFQMAFVNNVNVLLNYGFESINGTND